MQKIINYKLIMLIAFLGIISCNKENKIQESIEATTAQQNNSGSATFRSNQNAIQSMVSYNSQHDVLVFNSLQDVYNLQTYLQQQDPYDRGNSTQIIQELDNVLNYGFGSGNQSQGNQVSLPNLQTLLESSHPLSDPSLQKLLDVHHLVNFPLAFIKNILIGNLPFSYEVREKVGLVNHLSNAERALILDSDDNLLDRMDYVYEDFLKVFPNYHSTYERMINKNIQDLNAGMHVVSNNFDQCIIKTDFERLIRNEKYEIYIEGHLLKAYTDCKEVMFKEAIAGAYQALQKVNPAGNPTIPTMNETAQGVSKSIIDQAIPPTYASYDPQEFEPINTNTDPNYNTALQTFNIVERCATSNFVPERYTDPTNTNTIVFQNTTDFSNVYDPSTIYQYWDFGDGTGSFQTNPVHTFSTYGTYQVILTSFSTDCGCWHRHKEEVIIYGGARPPGGNPDCKIYPKIGVTATSLTFTINVQPSLYPATSGSTVVEYDYHIFKGENGSPATTYVETVTSPFNNIDYTAASIGKYRVRVDARWSDGCLSSEFTDPLTLLDASGNATPGCCNKKEKNKEKALPFTIGSNEYEFKYKDIIRGTLPRRVGGQQTLYKKNGRGKMRRVKADHDVIVGSNVCRTLVGGECTITWNNYGDPTNVGKERSFEYGNYWNLQDKFAFTGTCDFTHSCRYGSDLVVDNYLSTLVCD